MPESSNRREIEVRVIALELNGRNQEQMTFCELLLYLTIALPMLAILASWLGVL